jgi:hypothetical protein
MRSRASEMVNKKSRDKSERVGHDWRIHELGVSMGVVWAPTMHGCITELFLPCARDTDQRSAMLACAPPTPVSNGKLVCAHNAQPSRSSLHQLLNMT